jgi:hypothetical protein
VLDDVFAVDRADARAGAILLPIRAGVTDGDQVHAQNGVSTAVPPAAYAPMPPQMIEESHKIVRETRQSYGCDRETVPLKGSEKATSMLTTNEIEVVPKMQSKVSEW